MQKIIFNVIKTIPYFTEMSDDVLSDLADLAELKSYPKNAVIIGEKDESNELYIILSGRVKVYLDGENDKQVLLSYQDVGSYFGELSLLDNGIRSASVKAMEPTACAIIQKSDFIQWLLEHPNETIFGLFRSLTERIKVLSENIRNLASCDVYSRFAMLLNRLAEKEENERVIRGKFSHQDFANEIGSSREMVTRLMRQLRLSGHISVEPDLLRIHKELPKSSSELSNKN